MSVCAFKLVIVEIERRHVKEELPGVTMPAKQRISWKIWDQIFPKSDEFQKFRGLCWGRGFWGQSPGLDGLTDDAGQGQIRQNIPSEVVYKSCACYTIWRVPKMGGTPKLSIYR